MNYQITIKRNKMKTVTISELWETGRQILTINDGEFDRPQTMADLNKFNNVLVGERIEQRGPYEVIIDNNIYLISPTTVKHPQGGTMHILEVE